MSKFDAVNATNTTALRASKLRARSDGTFGGALVSAGFYAKKNGKPMFVYRGNSYGHEIWQATYKRSMATNRVNNYSGVIFTVSPDLLVEMEELSR